MATVRPFRGITYDPTRIPDPSAVTCPPYDVISDTDRDRLYERHPYNVVRIVSGRQEPDDTDRENKYVRACGFFRSWLWEGVLREDHAPAVYVYRQAFDDPTGHKRRVWGILATIGLDDEVLAHEKTMAGPKADRLALMKEVPANLSPIYAIYREEGGGISSDLASWSGNAPVADFVDDEGSRHTVWAVHDDAFHEKIAAALLPSALLIADGHHRFETAKSYRDGRRASDGDGSWDSTLAFLVDVGAQPALILPYHRIVRRIVSTDPLSVLGERFSIREVGSASDRIVDELARSLWAQRDTFGLVHDGRVYSLRPTEEVTQDIPAGVLASRALTPLGVGVAEDDLAFSPDAAVVAGEVTAGRAVCGFLIPPVDVERVWELASRGGKMPEKSTYFHPKPRDGIVIRALEPCGPPPGRSAGISAGISD